MNGRCDNDPLDPADDVCDLCGGEFCDTCMVERTKRTRQTVCMECSLIQARVRPGKIVRVRSRRDAKKRRKEIQSERHSMQDEGRFVFFDENGEEIPEPEPTSTKKTLTGRKKAEPSPPAGSQTAQNSNESDSDPESWVSQIDELIEPDVPELPPEEEFAVPLSPAVEKLEQLRMEGPDDSAPPAALRPKPSTPEPGLTALDDSDLTDFDSTDPFATSSPSISNAEPLAGSTPQTARPANQPVTPQTVPAPVPAALRAAPVPVPAALDPVPAALTTSAPVPAVLAGVSASTEPSQASSGDTNIPDVFRVDVTADAIDIETNQEAEPENTGEWVPPILRG